jgi:hypothetical protein
MLTIGGIWRGHGRWALGISAGLYGKTGGSLQDKKGWVVVPFGLRAKAVKREILRSA